jgi:hypothetical protein
MANFSFYVYQGDYDNEIKSIFLYSFKTRKEKGSIIEGFNELKVEISNIGFGVAKNVKWNWNFDLKKAKSIICKDQSIKWGQKEDVLSIDSTSLTIGWVFDITEDNIGGNFNFILPYSNETRVAEIVIPEYFIYLYWLYMVNQITNKEPKSMEDLFPPLELTLNYTDIHSNSRTKIFSIDLNFDMISEPGENTKQVAKFRFEISEK